MQIHTYPVTGKTKKSRVVGPLPVIKYPFGFFDGETTLETGGAGIHLGISLTHTFNIKFGCGHNTNTRAELLALWILLYFAEAIGLLTLHIYGDSSVVINWANNKATLSSSDLGYWCESISRLKDSFHRLDFQHVYKEHITRADGLSKEALSVATGLFSFIETYEEDIIGGGEYQLF